MPADLGQEGLLVKIGEFKQKFEKILDKAGFEKVPESQLEAAMSTASAVGLRVRSSQAHSFKKDSSYTCDF